MNLDPGTLTLRWCGWLDGGHRRAVLIRLTVEPRLAGEERREPCCGNREAEARRVAGDAPDVAGIGLGDVRVPVLAGRQRLPWQPLPQRDVTVDVFGAVRLPMGAENAIGQPKRYGTGRSG